MPESTPPLTSFAELARDHKLPEAWLANLEQLGYAEMTPIQAMALPLVLAGKDVLGQAKTGSGKTAAFGLGVLKRVDVQRFKTQALILCPTRELAEQVAAELRRLAKAIPNTKILTLCGGRPLGPQIGSLQHSAHIIVGTPGRVLQHLNKKTLRLGELRTLVLDEADRMLDMGFTDELKSVMEFLPKNRQTLLFSATYPRGIKELSRGFQKDAVTIDATALDSVVEIEHYWCLSEHKSRHTSLLALLSYWSQGRTLVFCNTIADVQEVTTYLHEQGVVVGMLHGDMEQPHRQSSLLCFSLGSLAVLVATDVAARGLDISNVDLVVNFELPNRSDLYIHRVGRTARAGGVGVALSVVTDRQQTRLHTLANDHGLEPVQFSHLPFGKQMPKVPAPAVTTIEINGGRNKKLRPGDLLGALTSKSAGKGALVGSAVGKIDIQTNYSCVAVANASVDAALERLNGQPIKGQRLKARRLQPPVVTDPG